MNHVRPSISCNDPVPQSHFNKVDGMLNEMSTTLLESRSSSPSSKIQRSLELILFVRTDDRAKISNH